MNARWLSAAALVLLPLGSMASAQGGGHWVNIPSYAASVEKTYNLTNESRTFRSVTPRVQDDCGFEAVDVWYKTVQYDRSRNEYVITWLPLEPSMHKPEFVTQGSQPVTSDGLRVRYSITRSGTVPCWVEIGTSMVVSRGL